MATPITIDRLHAVRISGPSDVDQIAHINATSEIQAAPETLRHLPAKDLTSANLHKIVAILGIAGEMKVAASGNGSFDIAVLDRALSKTHLSLSDRIRVKIALLGSGFDGKAF